MHKISFCFLVLALISCSREIAPRIELSSTESELREAHRHSERSRDQARFHNRALPEGSAGIDVTAYKLKGNFGWAGKEGVLDAELTTQLEITKAAKTLALHSRVAKVSDVKLSTGEALPFKTENGFLLLDYTGHEALTKPTLVIRYTAKNHNDEGAANGLHAVPARAGDPVGTPVAFTLSEPEGAPEWMPCHDTPSDRAVFETEFTVKAGETLIANGDLVQDARANDKRVMGYKTRYTIPTYLMAFAIGDFTVATQYHQKLPIQVVARRGLPVDYEGMLGALTSMMKTIESKLGPYPFEKYAIVVLPEYRGGMEHAGITFQAEIGSTQGSISYDFGLSAHELTHQWFGDLMTIKSWNDLWIKEGMATLMAEEATRAFEDKNGSGRLFGRNFGVRPGDAVIDTELAPDDKYTSGPYGRAAWVYTQVRKAAGDQAFFEMLRKALTDHRFGAVSTDEILDYFSKVLDADTLARVKRALIAKKVPRLEALGGEPPSIGVKDDDKALIVPLEVRWYDEKGEYTSELILPGNRVKLPNNDTRLLVLDPEDVHAMTAFGTDQPQVSGVISPFVSPRTAAQRKTLLSLSASVALLALNWEESWNVGATEYATLWPQLPSEEARYLALEKACNLGVKSQGAAKGEWATAVSRFVLAPPYLGMPNLSEGVGLSNCRTLFPESLFATKWAELEQDPASPRLSETDVVFLSNFAAPSAIAFKSWSQLALNGRSLRIRAHALLQLFKHLKGVGQFETPANDQQSVWKAFFRRLLATFTAAEIVTPSLKAVLVTKDLEAIPALAYQTKTHAEPLQSQVLCAAHRLAKDTPDGWTKYVDALGTDHAFLSAAAKKKLEKPELCDESGNRL